MICKHCKMPIESSEDFYQGRQPPDNLPPYRHTHSKMFTCERKDGKPIRVIDYEPTSSVFSYYSAEPEERKEDDDAKMRAPESKQE